eukprot:12623062-Alexandrium_andersonii.AAC.1
MWPCSTTVGLAGVVQVTVYTAALRARGPGRCGSGARLHGCVPRPGARQVLFRCYSTWLRSTPGGPAGAVRELLYMAALHARGPG